MKRWTLLVYLLLFVEIVTGNYQFSFLHDKYNNLAKSKLQEHLITKLSFSAERQSYLRQKRAISDSDILIENVSAQENYLSSNCQLYDPLSDPNYILPAFAVIELKSSGLNNCDFLQIQYLADHLLEIDSFSSLFLKNSEASQLENADVNAHGASKNRKSSYQDVRNSENLLSQIFLNTSSIVSTNSNLGSILETTGQIISGDQNIPLSRTIENASNTFTGVSKIFNTFSSDSEGAILDKILILLENSHVGDITQNIKDLIDLDILSKQDKKFNSNVISHLIEGSNLGILMDEHASLGDFLDAEFLSEEQKQDKIISFDQFFSVMSSDDLTWADKLAYLLDGSMESEILTEFNLLRAYYL